VGLFRADDDLVINQHVYGIGAAYAPVVHLRRRTDGQLHATYTDSFERIWATAKPLSNP
jgi:hypothetical protein